MFKNMLAIMVALSFLFANGAQAACLSCEHGDGITYAAAHSLASQEGNTPAKSSLDCEQCCLVHHHSHSGNLDHHAASIRSAEQTSDMVAWNDHHAFDIGVKPSIEPPSHI